MPKFEYRYDVLNPGQYPEVLGQLAETADDGWQIKFATLNYNELYLLWEREKSEGEQPEAQGSGLVMSLAVGDSVDFEKGTAVHDGVTYILTRKEEKEVKDDRPQTGK